MMKTCIKLSLLAVIISGALITSCKKKDKDDPAPDPKTTAPEYTFDFIKVGNSARMDVRIKFGTLEFNYPDSGKLIVNSNLGNNKYEIFFRADLPAPIGPQGDTLIWLKDATGLYQIDSIGAKWMIMKSNPVVGDLYLADTSATDSTYRKVVSISKSINVPAGTFICAEIKEYKTTDDPNLTYSTTFINKIKGFIQRADVSNGDTTILVKLRSTNF
jgi:hypothetical protein